MKKIVVRDIFIYVPIIIGGFYYGKEELEKRIGLFIFKKQRDPRLLIDIFKYLDENKKNKLFVNSYNLQIILITRKARYVLQIENLYLDAKIYTINITITDKKNENKRSETN